MDPAERRELILSAARRAFASRPYEEVSLAEVAQEPQASEALVHKYFAGTPPTSSPSAPGRPTTPYPRTPRRATGYAPRS